jgi:NAD(P)-dependent dehydrogenase (short-subunit alcohol dehydrogenase family)
MRVQNKVAIVTGAGSGIGRATAELLAEEGAKVVVADIDPKGGNETVKAIQEKGNTAHFVEADISQEADAKRISDQAVKTYGGIDILVNNAATFVLKGFEASVEEWQRSLGVNVIGTAIVTKYAVEHMKKKGGSIVILGSISSFLAQPDFFAYSATKGSGTPQDSGERGVPRVDHYCGLIPAHGKSGYDAGGVQCRGRGQDFCGQSGQASGSSLRHSVSCLG